MASNAEIGPKDIFEIASNSFHLSLKPDNTPIAFFQFIFILVHVSWINVKE
jgi:hypothetical protein